MTNPFYYQHGSLYAEEAKLTEIIQQVGSPFYLYSQNTIKENYLAFEGAFQSQPHQICYAVKANSNLAVLGVLAQLGSGFDIVSRGELMRVLKAGGLAKKTIFSGVGKQPEEMAYALKQGVGCFNVESKEELETLHHVAEHLNCQAPIALRINPDIDPQSHPFISTGLKENKFGIPLGEAFDLYQQARHQPHFTIQGISCHIGSQLTTLDPFITLSKKLFQLVNQLSEIGITLQHVNFGGGLGVPYQTQPVPSPQDYVDTLMAHCPLPEMLFIIEPGRAIVANSGILVTKILYLKQSGEKHFCIVDSAMNDFMRPMLYDAWQNIIPIKLRDNVLPQIYDVVGPVCETGDCLGKSRSLIVESGDYLAICMAGAYGYTMSSNYNTRPRIAEVMVKQQEFKIVKPAETIEALLAGEKLW